MVGLLLKQDHKDKEYRMLHTWTDMSYNLICYYT